MTEIAQSHEEMLAMNEALVLGSLRQHELAEVAESLSVKLQSEITVRKVAEEALAKVAGELAGIQSAISEAAIIAVTDVTGKIEEVNDNFVRVSKYSREELVGQDHRLVSSGLHPKEFIRDLWVTIANGKVWRNEIHNRAKDGSLYWVDTTIAPILNGRGKLVKYLAVRFDITERKHGEERQRFLMNELEHRGKNVLAVVQSLVFLSLSGTRSLTEAREVLTQRIQALARSQTTLLRGGFEGASVTEIVRLEFEAFSERVKAVGSDVMLNPRAAQTFGLVVHELATNATKYGALSRPGGQIAIHWSIESAGAEARFKFQWQERGGPPVAPPTHRGFGRIVLEKAVGQDFGAQPEIRFAPEGLSYAIDAPLSVVAAVRGPVLK